MLTLTAEAFSGRIPLPPSFGVLRTPPSSKHGEPWYLHNKKNCYRNFSNHLTSQTAAFIST
jgi:hypothetical protein